MNITIDISPEHLAGLREFANDFAHWHLDGRNLSDSAAIMLCVFYTATNPERPNEVGVCGLDPAEIDDAELIEAMRGQDQPGSKPTRDRAPEGG